MSEPRWLHGFVHAACHPGQQANAIFLCCRQFLPVIPPMRASSPVACTALHLQLPGEANTACTLLQVMLRLAESPAFVAAMAAQQDYEASVLQKAHRILTDTLGEYAHAARLQALLEQVRSQGMSSDGMLGPAMAASSLPIKLPVQAARTGSTLHSDGVPAGAMAALLLQTRWVLQAGSTLYILSAHHSCHRLGQQLAP